MRERRKVCVMGLGYIGLPTASLLGTKGYDVLGVDVEPARVEAVNAGVVSSVEPDLDMLVRSAVGAGRLRASLAPEPADVFVIAVPTPLKGGAPDLSAVEAATRALAPCVRPGNLVVLESTSPVGTTEGLVGGILAEHGHAVGTSVHVAHCPERVLPGRILIELVENDRIVGGVTPASTEAAVRFYEGFVSGAVLATDARTAELVKLAENSFRDVNIAFANELSTICDREGISVWKLIQLANRHPRVDILRPGPGVGGHCIAVDPWFIVHRTPDAARLIRTAREVNDARPDWVFERVRAAARAFVRPTIACLGVAFKADVDDLRESPALEIVRRLAEEDLGEILVVEPNLDGRGPDARVGGLELVPLAHALERADIVLVLVDHKELKRLDPAVFAGKVLIDTRGLYP
jgi:UDP-N-acetyl-D-mannosaminuronic acid dehydrogenase